MTEISDATYLDPIGFDAIFSVPTGSRASLNSNVVFIEILGRMEQSSADLVAYNATATDVFLKFDGVVRRLFVDVDRDFGFGRKHIWLSDGPAVLAPSGLFQQVFMAKGHKVFGSTFNELGAGQFNFGIECALCQAGLDIRDRSVGEIQSELNQLPECGKKVFSADKS